ncbi:hypothetical protein PROFUN_07625 [Planoprotostelium fungivorum]|uniref:Zinc-hook domain-containing protein n=1 Tax=Planoprotostelium fungivorum TaxID=1890364 RepID=A0A2P6NK50_9EUKA|nr:hypothetical protein PROFUN_07625 [Planoprotostelium fungivorum]
MTSVDKLLIRGIRSFSPENEYIIEFYKPLTIIVGQNGAGKTTIIECLKYACTGEAPPNTSKGQAFIHDPKVAGEREIKAQIKLRFKSKAKTLEMKTLESALQAYKDTGEKVSQSYRCADLDALIPDLMGASKAILESVIFCHQEDSNWPLSDSSTLKKKFDEIFAATKYTKALESIKKEKKQQTDHLKEYKLKMETVQVTRSQYIKMIKELEEWTAKATEAQEEIDHLKEVFIQKKSRIDLLKNKQSGAQEEIQEVVRMKATKDRLVQESKKLYQNLRNDMSDESESDLKNKSARHDTDMDTLDQRRMSLVEKLSDLEIQGGVLTKESIAAGQAYGQATAALITRQKVAKELEEKIIQFTKKYHVAGFESGPFGVEEVQKLFSTIESMLNQLAQKSRAEKAKYQAATDDISKQLDTVQKESAKLQERLRQKKETMNDQNNRSSVIQKELSEKKRAKDKIESINTQIREKKAALEALQKSIQGKNDIENLTEEKSNVDARIHELGKVMETLSSLSAAHAALQATRRDRTVRKEKYESILEDFRDEFERILGEVPLNLGEMKGKLESEMRQKKAVVSEVEKMLEKDKTNFSILDGQYQTIQQQLRKMEMEAKEHRKKLQKVPETHKLPDLIHDAEKNTEKVKKDIAMTQSAGIMYENFVKSGKEDHNCPLCERSFERDSQLQAFIQKLETALKAVPESLKSSKSQLKESELLLNELKKLTPYHDSLSKLEAREIPEVKTKMDEVSEKKKKLEGSIEKLTADFSRLSTEDSQLNKLTAEADKIGIYYREYLELDKQARSQEAQLSTKTTDTRSLGEVNAEIGDLQRKSKELNQKIDQMRRESTDRQNQVLQATNALHVLERELSNMKAASNDIERLASEMDNIEVTRQETETGIREIEENIAKIRGNIQELSKKRSESVRQGEEHEATVQQQKDAFQNRISQLQSLERQLREITVTGDIEGAERKKKKAEEALEDNERDKKGIQEQIQDISSQIANSENLRRDLSDNLKYREQLREIRDLETKIKQREAKMGVSVDNAEYMQELSTLEKEYANVKSKYDNLCGQKQNITQQMTSHQKEINKPNYKSVDEQYKQLSIRLATTEMANGDLEKYYKALEKALMHFHSLKMSEINKVIMELWQSTYKGTDIDAIQLRANSESTSARASSYNYRVVMMKAGVELDMRGRCSAGQKVLASLVIRLALAEAFCINCGILALDEPTTNLDRQNVESFANALVNIIETRRQQSNFQLVIITHDEEFVQLIGKSNNADYYWRISKTPSGHSKIECQEIAEL